MKANKSERYLRFGYYKKRQNNNHLPTISCTIKVNYMIGKMKVNIKSFLSEGNNRTHNTIRRRERFVSTREVIDYGKQGGVVMTQWCTMKTIATRQSTTNVHIWAEESGINGETYRTGRYCSIYHHSLSSWKSQRQLYQNTQIIKCTNIFNDDK